MNNTRIILASASPRRHQLLRQIGLSFTVIPADIGEEIAPGSDPAETVQNLSLQKALMISEKPDVRDTDCGILIVGADTIVVHNGEILGKPSDPDQAVEMLRSLSGQTHQVYTGVALVFRNSDSRESDANTPEKNTQAKFRDHVFHERTDVTFGNLNDAEIAAYVEGGSPMDKAGAYGIQDDLGALFVERISGDYYNVVGFPLFRFYREVNKLMSGIVTPFEPASGVH